MYILMFTDFSNFSFVDRYGSFSGYHHIEEVHAQEHFVGESDVCQLSIRLWVVSRFLSRSPFGFI